MKAYIGKFKLRLATSFKVFILSEIGVHHKKDHIKISQFTKFEIVSLDCNHVEDFQNIGKNRDSIDLGDAISESETFVFNLGDL